jgi:hypothetical protein
LQFDLLLHDLAARFGGLQLRLAPGGFQRGQAVAGVLHGVLGLLHAHAEFFQLDFGLGQFFLLRALALPLVALRAQRSTGPAGGCAIR